MKKLLKILLFLLCFPAWAFGAVAFDGTGDEERVTDPNVGSTTATVCFFMKAPAFEDGEIVAYYGNGPDLSTGRGWSIDEQSDDATHGKLKFRQYAGASSTIITSPQLTTNTWYHLCIVGRGSPDSQIYLDATDATADVTTDNDAYTIQNSTDDFVIGTLIPNSTIATMPNDSDNIIAHFGYWNTALTGAQVASIANKSTCPTAVQAANLKVFISLDANGSGTTTDSNAWTYTESGNPTTDAGPGGLPCGAGGGGSAIEATLQVTGYH